jgi:aspartyl-tRNA(Asn)/glutamyl-tRNA(Gln) amidotransferase subunit B
LPLYDAEILTEERSLSDYFEETVSEFGGDPKIVSNWLMNDVLRLIRENNINAGQLQLRPQHLAEIIRMVEAKQITNSTGKGLLEKVEKTGNDPRTLVEEEGLGKVSDEDTVRSIIQEVLSANPEQVAIYQGGKTTLIGWFVGQIMRETKGQADAQLARAILEELLND